MHMFYMSPHVLDELDGIAKKNQSQEVHEHIFQCSKSLKSIPQNRSQNRSGVSGTEVMAIFRF